MAESYTAHAVRLLDSIQLLKSKAILFDVTIEVEDELFQAHRMVLAAYSQYFRAMFSHDTKENQKGRVEMKDVRSHAMKKCLDFMYTSQFSVDIDTVEDILSLADILQLDEVTKTCMDYLTDNLNSSNCIYVVKLLEIFSNETLMVKSKECMKRTFNNVINSTDFKQLSLSDVIEYVTETNSSDDTIWSATTSWIKHDEDDRGEKVLEFVKLMSFSSFPSYLMLKEMWSEKWFLECVKAKDLVVQRLFSDIFRLKRNLDPKNCYFFKQLADSYEHVTEDAKKVILFFLKQNLDLIMARDEFLSYSKDDVSVLLSSADAEYLTSENMKWRAMVRWLEHNEGNDDALPQMLQCIDFDSLSTDFIKTVVKDEPLVKKYDENGEFLFDKIAHHKKRQKTSFVVLFEDSSMKEWNMATKTWSSLPNLSTLWQHHPRHVINLNNNLCLLKGCKLFHLTKRGKWIEKAKLQHAVAHNAKVVVCDGWLYIAERNHLSKYIPDKNEWLESLSACSIEPLYVTASEKCIYLSASQQSDIMQYDPGTDLWSKFCSSPNITYDDILFSNSILFALGKVSMAFYDIASETWVQKKWFLQSGELQLDFFDINGNIAAFGMRKQHDLFLQIYDAGYGHWMKFALSSEELMPNIFSAVEQPQSSSSGAFSFGCSNFSSKPSFSKKSGLQKVSACSFTKRRGLIG